MIEVSILLFCEWREMNIAEVQMGCEIEKLKCGASIDVATNGRRAQYVM
jgi:hypothetical protein